MGPSLQPTSNAEVPADFKRELGENKGALAFFRTLNMANVYAVVFRLESAKKAEVRKAMIRRMIEMLERGEKFH